MTSRRTALQEDLRFRILKLLEENPEMSQRDIAAAMGVGLGSVNYCLNALVQKGLLKLGNFTSAKDRRRYAYILTPSGVAEKTALMGRFLKRKTAEYELLRAEISELQQALDAQDSAVEAVDIDHTSK